MRDRDMEQKLKCHICNKKLGFNSFSCKCDKVFCSKHRYPETHKCDFDFKSDGKNELKKTLIKIEPHKIVNI